MEIIQRNIFLSDNQSFIVRELELKDNKGIIHTHDQYELNYIVDAYGKRFVAGNISNFMPGDLIFIGPDVPHCWEIENKEMMPRAITIHFNKEFFENSLNQLPELSFLQVLTRKARHGLFIKGIDQQKLQSLYEGLTEDNPLESLIKVFRLLRYVASVEESLLLANFDYVLGYDIQQNNRIKKIHEYVFHNFKSNIALSDIASLIGISEGAFCAYFKKYTKKTFFTFLKETRIRYACKLLIEDFDKPISVICYECGYNNTTNFYRQFKEITRMNPKNYREKHK